MSEYPWNEKNNTFTWLSSLYNPFKWPWLFSHFQNFRKQNEFFGFILLFHEEDPYPIETSLLS